MLVYVIILDSQFNRDPAGVTGGGACRSWKQTATSVFYYSPVSKYSNKTDVEES